MGVSDRLNSNTFKRDENEDENDVTNIQMRKSSLVLGFCTILSAHPLREHV